MSRSKWNAVNTPAALTGKKLDEEIIGKMSRAVQLYYKIPTLRTNGVTLQPEADAIINAVARTLDVFILEKEEDREKLLKLIFRYVKKFMNKSVDELRINKISTKSRYDDKNTIIIKNDINPIILFSLISLLSLNNSLKAIIFFCIKFII